MFISQDLSGPPGTPVLGQVLPQNVEAPHKEHLLDGFFNKKKLVFWALKLRGSCFVGLYNDEFSLCGFPEMGISNSWLDGLVHGKSESKIGDD